MTDSLSGTAYTMLRADILSGAIPGDTLWSDREIAGRLNLSRTPVREAIQRLAAEGLVKVIPRRGTRVLSLKPDDVREIHQISKALELEAALILLTCTDADLSPLHEAVDTMAAALDRGDRNAWAEADMRFHLGVVDMCGNKRLAGLYHQQRGLTDRARYFALHLRELPTRSTEEHRAMLQKLESRDAAGLERIYREHWDRTTAELLELIARHGTPVPNVARWQEPTQQEETR